LGLKTSENWPNFFIVGAARSGTTSLYEYLGRVPGVYMPTVKEPHYFAPSVPENNHISRFVTHDKTKYLSLYKDVKDEPAVGDASPSYLVDVDSPKAIHSIVPDARIIMILRDPIERAFSHYLMNVRERWETLPFYDAIQKDYTRSQKGYFVSHLYVETGFYSGQVERYLRTFGSSRVKILIFEEFIKDTEAAVKDVLEFLGLPMFIPSNAKMVYNPHSHPIERGQLVRRISKIALRSKTSARVREGLRTVLPNSSWRAIRKKFLPVKDSLTQDVVLKTSCKPNIPENARVFLQKLYNEDVVKLKLILGRELSWNNFMEPTTTFEP
jgi:hypothetical protein